MLSFPIDGAGPAPGPRELGDVVICPEHTADLTEAAVHGVLHLCGYDHETDDGEMLALQARDPGDLDCEQRATDEQRGPASSASPGRPNVGKSTLVNAIVGAKVAIVSDRPQTTRRASRGVATDLGAGWQLVLVDLPGVQRPRDVLTERMQRRVEQELEGADAVLFVVNGEQGVGPGDRFIAAHLLAGAPRRAGDLRGQQDRPAHHGRDDRGARRRRGARRSSTRSSRSRRSAARGSNPLIDRLAELIPEGPFCTRPRTAPTSRARSTSPS